MDHPDQYVLADIALARRLERAEAASNADFVEARARVEPASGAAWIEVGGTYAMFDGVASPCTQTFGLGLFGPVTAAQMDEIESFFRDHGAPVFHEVSPLADPTAVSLLNARGYQPFEFTSVLCQPIAAGLVEASRHDRIQVRRTAPEENDLWVRTAAQGWSELPGVAEFMLAFASISAERRTAVSFLAELDGQPIATGGLCLHEGVALLAGASTVPEGRKQGAQLALLDSRLRYAADVGCDLAMMCALPGSASQRNAERQGFRIAYTRIKWRMADRRV